MNVERVVRIFTDPDYSSFGPYIAAGRVVQWGGMADPFDDYERRYGVGLELLRFFRERRYPITFSTKGAFFVNDDRYVSLLKGAEHFHFKVSIITTDPVHSSRIEIGCPSPDERLDVIRKLRSFGVGGVTLRLRPYIIGVSDKTASDLLARARDAGADSVSTEFMCLDARARLAAKRYHALSKIVGFDVVGWYKRNSPGQCGYLRLAREVKRPYIERLQSECERLGLRLYVSDAHFKELCPNGSCCGMRPEWPYSRGQFTEALLIAKRDGSVRFSQISGEMDVYPKDWMGMINCPNVPVKRARLGKISIKDYIRRIWNHVNGPRSPYKYFGGVLRPKGRDENGDVIYEYAP